MRDIKRIDGFLEEIKNIWKENFPDWRFGQLVENLNRYHGDLFYLEEKDFLRVLKSFVNEYKYNQSF